MADNIIKETVPFNFDDIYSELVTKFAEKGYDSPYDGSNLAQLITSMAYTTSMLNTNTAININETILTLAQKRQNIIQDARILGYEIGKKTSYVYEIELKFKETKFYTISKYTEFTSSGNKYYYMGDDLEIDGVIDNTIKIYVKEGELIKSEDDPDNLRQIVADNQYFDIPFTNVEAEGIEVFVTNYTQEGILANRIKYIKSETLLIDSTDNMTQKFIRLEDNEMETPRVYFVLSDVGTPVPRGAIVEFNILRSNGADGIIVGDLSVSRDDLEVLSNYTVVIKGTESESNQSIKDNAPVLHNTASRVVTANDYSVVCKKHPAVAEAFIFGGEDEVPKKLGNIYFTVTPEKAQRTFSNDSENTIYTLDNNEDVENNYLLPADYISNSVDSEGHILNPGIIDIIRTLNLPALEYNIRNPNYIFLDFDITVVKYSLSSVKKDVRAKIFELLNNQIKELETFQTEFFNSNTIKLIDDYLTDITGLDMSVKFKILVDSKSVSTESIPYICTNTEKSINPYLDNPAYEYQKEYRINIYLDTPFEGLYDNNGNIIHENLPNIETPKFINGLDLSIDKSLYIRLTENDISMSKIEYILKLGNDKVGTYTIYNGRTIYIKVKIYCKNTEINNESIDNPEFDEIDIKEFDVPRYLNLKYPSENIKTLRSSIFKLNSVKIK